MQNVSGYLWSGWEALRRAAAKLGPYVLIEILMPGGTLLALLLFLYQRRQAASANPRPMIATRTALAPCGLPLGLIPARSKR